MTGFTTFPAKRGRWVRALLLGGTAMLLLVLFAGAACASEGSGTSNPVINLILRIISFVIFVGIIWKFGGPGIKGALCGRRQRIAQELKDLEESKAKAMAELASMKERIANIEADRQAILAEFRAQAEAQRAAILEKAEKTARHITDQARRTAESELNAIVAHMRAEVAEMVAAAAEEQLTRLNTEDQEKLIDKYLTKVVLN